MSDHPQGSLCYPIRPGVNQSDVSIDSYSEAVKHWIAGFIEGEGSFCVVFKLKADLRMGIQVAPEMSVTQHASGKAVLELVKKTLGGIGSEIKIKEQDTNVMVYRVTNLKELLEVVIPFLHQYMIVSARRKEIETLTKVCTMMQNKDHLTVSGMTTIINLVFDTPLKKSNRQLSKADLLYVLGNKQRVVDMILRRRANALKKRNGTKK